MSTLVVLIFGVGMISLSLECFGAACVFFGLCGLLVKLA